MNFRNPKRAAASVLFILFLYIPTVLVFYFAWSKEFVPLEEFESIRFVVLLLFLPIILKYLIQLLVAPFYPAIEYVRSKKRLAGTCPTVSVIIPAWNEEIGILKTIASITPIEPSSPEIKRFNDPPVAISKMT